MKSLILLFVFCSFIVFGSASSVAGDYNHSFSVSAGSGTTLSLSKRISEKKDFLYSTGFRYFNRKTEDDVIQSGSLTTTEQETFSIYTKNTRVDLSVGLRKYQNRTNFSSFAHYELGLGYLYDYRKSFRSSDTDKSRNELSRHHLGMVGFIGAGLVYFFSDNVSISGLYGLSLSYFGFKLGGETELDEYRVNGLGRMQVSFHW